MVFHTHKTKGELRHLALFHQCYYMLQETITHLFFVVSLSTKRRLSVLHSGVLTTLACFVFPSS